jgi:hypothetical protein
MKKIAYALTPLVAMIMALGVAAPAAQAKESDCKQAQVCFFDGSNFTGAWWYYWDDSIKTSVKYDIRSQEASSRTSSVINKTPYYAHIWNAQGQHRCLPPGYKFTWVGDTYDNKITHFGLYLDWC